MRSPDLTRVSCSRPQLLQASPASSSKTAKLYALVALFVAIASTFGCIHKAGGGQVTPFEKAVTYSDMLAQSNNSIAKGVIQAQQQGVLTVEQATRILSAQEQIATDHQVLTQILKLGPQGATSRAQELETVLAGIKTAIGNLDFARDGLGIKNPTSAQTFANDANAIVSFADVILADLTAAGVIK